MIGLKNITRHLLNQSEMTTKTKRDHRSHDECSRFWRRSRVFALRFYWLIVLFNFVLTSHCYNFGFRFTLESKARLLYCPLLVSRSGQKQGNRKSERAEEEQGERKHNLSIAVACIAEYFRPLDWSKAVSWRSTKAKPNHFRILPTFKWPLKIVLPIIEVEKHRALRSN